MGIMWNRPFVQVVVRPQRYTFEFMENFHEFTLCAFSEEFNKSLVYLGTHSGREGNKIAKSGFSPIKGSKVAAPVFLEAELIIECKKIYQGDVKASQFFDPEIDKNYSAKDYHKIYYGEVVYIEGTDKYLRK